MATLQERAEQIRDEVQEAANTAQRVGQLLIDLITQMKGADSRYLSGVRPDTAHAPIRFAQGLTASEVRTEGTEQVQGQLLVGDFISGQSGARINKDGAAEVETLTVRSRLEVAELQINRLTAVEGDWLLTESGTVERVEKRGAQWVLTMRRRFEGDITAFAVHDVIKGIVSTAAVRAFRPNTPLPTPETALYAVAWLRVESVDINDNSITCSLYNNADVPGGANMQPCEGMNLARWGNTSIAERRSCLYLSSREGRIMHLQGVTAPKITAEHQRASFGTLPEFLKSELGEIVDGKDDYLFARGLVVQDIIRLDAKANPIPEIVDRGNWTKGAKYFGGTRNPETKRFEISDVWLDGARWRCTTTKSEGTTETPVPNSIHWTLIQAKPKDGRDGAAGKSAPPTGANLIDGTSFRNMEEVRRWEHFDRFTFDTSQTDRVHPLAQAVCALKDLNWIKGSLKIASLLRPNTTYTISIYSKGAPGILAVHYAASPGTDRYVQCNNVDRNKWKRHTYTFTTTDTVPDNANIFLGCTDMLEKTYFSALKLEEGEEATAWCLSENDKTGTPAANPNLWHCTDYVTRPHFTKGYLNEKPYASILPGGVDGDNYFHIEGNNEERVAHVLDEPFGDRYPRGTWYTISFKCRGSGSARFHCYPMGWKKNRFYFPRVKREGIDGIGHGYLILYFRLTKEWTTHSLSFFYDEEEDDLPKILRTLFSLPKSEGNYLDICHPKMETGEFVTPWCLSEKDKKGERGEKGDPGIRGLQGLQGERGERGVPGEKGEKGKNGRGIERVESFYLLTASETPPAYETRGWTSTPPVPNKQTPWLWSYERVVYTDGKSERQNVRLITHLGKDGAVGVPTRTNLLDGTAFRTTQAWDLGLYGEHAQGEQVTNVQPAVTGCGVIRTAILPGVGAEEYAQYSQRLPYDLIPGQSYTFSVYVRGANTGWLIVYPNPGTHFRLEATKAGEWQRLSVTFEARHPKPGEENRAYLRCWAKNADTSKRNEVLFCAPKLEEGIEATPWCLSENDKVGTTVQYRGFWPAFPDGTVFNGERETGGGYEDVVEVLTPAGTRETYRCTQTHRKSEQTRPNANSPYWKKGDSFEMVSTRLLLAGSAQVDKLSTGNISQDRMVTAGAEMRFYAAGCKHPGLVFGYRSDTQNRRFPVMQCFDPETGALLYDLGPEGIFANARKVAGTWTPLEMIRLTRNTTISQLYNWLKKEKDNSHDPEIEEMKVISPYNNENGKEYPLYTFGYGAYYTEGWSEFRRADGSMHKIFESSRTSIPSEDYPAAVWFNPWPQYFTTDPPEKVLVDQNGASMGDLNDTRVEDGWYCSRRCPIRVEIPDHKVIVHGERRNTSLYAIDLWKFHAGKKVETGTTYFLDYDLDFYPEAANDGRAHKGRDFRGIVYEESLDTLQESKAIFEIQGFKSRTNTSIKPQQN